MILPKDIYFSSFSQTLLPLAPFAPSERVSAYGEIYGSGNNLGDDHPVKFSSHPQQVLFLFPPFPGIHQKENVFPIQTVHCRL